ncbi:MAG: HYR domain-containing protein, partial [Bacteroidetes bacterium]|nr:HYR domain-containing protein [Bacteroidota bacterium]
TGCNYTQTWTANVSDGCSNAATAVSITHTWKEDLVKPVISSTATSGDLGCNPTVAAPTFTASDNCDGDISSAIVVTTAGPTGPACARTQTWTANVSDGCSNAATTVSITYTWKEDLVKPVISTTATSGDLGCNPTVAAPTFTASDNCDGDISSAIVVTTTGPTGPACARTQTWTANVSDGCSNAATTVSITYTWKEDSQAPTVTKGIISGCYTSKAAAEAAVLAATTYSDNCTANANLNVDIASNIDDPCNAKIIVTVIDGCNNVGFVDYTVSIDATIPVITATGTTLSIPGYNPSAATIDAALGSATATDNCSVGTPTYTDSPVTVDGCEHSQTRTWNVTDGCGNPATPVSRTVTWLVDVTPPSITCPPMQTVTLNVACGAVLADYTSLAVKSDNCGGPVSITQSPLPGTVIGGTGTTPVTLTVTDEAGNTNSCTFSVIKSSSLGPVINLTDPSLANGSTSLFATDPGACSTIVLFDYFVTMPCGGELGSVSATGIPSGHVFPKGSTLVTITATDLSGNTSTYSFTIKVYDGAPPTISCPAPVTVYTSGAAPVNIPAATIGTATGSDNCGAATITAIRSDALALSSPYPVGTT